ncbi:MAG: YraN family protein [Trueperaceae bacterium]|nr:YraN family protein [Trueperaceae bacterium]
MGGRHEDRSRPELRQAPRSHWAERVARDYLERRGWRTLATNYRLRGGEIDLVMQTPAGEQPGEQPGDQESTVVFVEVKQRASHAHGHAAEAISRRKLTKIRLAANHYLAFKLRNADARSRIDAVLVSGTETEHAVTHLEAVG